MRNTCAMRRWHWLHSHNISLKTNFGSEFNFVIGFDLVIFAKHPIINRPFSIYPIQRKSFENEGIHSNQHLLCSIDVDHFGYHFK